MGSSQGKEMSGVGDEGGGFARFRWCEGVRDGAEETLDGGDDVEDGVPIACAHICREGGISSRDVFEGKEMGGGEVGDMDIVADGCPIPIDGEGMGRIYGCPDGIGNEVCFGRVGLPDQTRCVSAGRIKIAEDGCVEGVIGEHLFNEVFRFPIGIDGALWMAFWNGKGVGNTIDRGC